ncbi:2-dehydro-3-deoxy-D-gluconate 5-dehydrogenase [Planctomycetes bacterium CA13]|uniref:2-dehydro-3-deoxy-D-gluconate 5-dehydrogenase n=1 Tax=Novipirellula herctigrandis TaxID=2527986 RepID=A0A5C5Z651_9BACT|nr:2-dehydro-3-deoxy-D-gluconate 5-dehydrogenase [Planctomycetes bacterium CA13]
MNESPFSLTGDVALITGGGTGLGLGMAEAMIHAGAKVAITGRREAPLQEAVNQLGQNAIYIVGDVTKDSDRNKIVTEAAARLNGPISILVNNAGQNMKKPAMETSDEEFDSLLETHVKASLALSRLVAPGMFDRESGNILFIASMASYMGVPNIIGYTAAKTAVLGLVRALATEWSPKGIRINAIAPGWIETPMTRKAFDGDPERKRKVLSRTPLNRMGLPADIGNAAVFLCSPAANFVTGQTFPIDGGASIGF